MIHEFSLPLKLKANCVLLSLISWQFYLLLSFWWQFCHKHCIVSLPLHFKSNHPHKQKLVAFNILIFCAHNICSNSKLFNNKINYIKSIAANRGCSLNNHIIFKFSKVFLFLFIRNFKMLLCYLFSKNHYSNVTYSQ